MKIVKLQSVGKEIDTLQTLLGIPTNAKHEFDAATHNAVVEFQKNHGLVADGVVGYKSWEALLFQTPSPKEGITEQQFKRAAALLDCEPAALKAVQKVETGGKGGFLPSGRPRILFEGHFFWKLLKTAGIDPIKHRKGNEDIIYEKWTKAYYKGGEGEYLRLDRARKINIDAANGSASWGMFQIMGSNYKLCSEASVASFVKAMCESDCKQLLLSCRFIYNSKTMLAALQKKDWATFAKLYNGPAYAQNQYDKKLAAAYKSYVG